MNTTKYFEGALEEVSFLELKNNIEKIPMDLKGLPLPVKNSEIVELARDPDNNLKVESVVEGIAYVLGATDDFPYLEDYKRLIYLIDPNIIDYYLSQGLKKLQSQDKSSIYFFRAGYVLEPDNEMNSTIYARELFKRALDFEENDRESQESFRKEGIKILERVTIEKDDFPLAHYYLGICYEETGYYQKALVYYKKALERTNDDLAKEDIEEKISSIKQDALLEEAISMIDRNEYKRAIDLLNEVTKDTNRFDAWYYMGYSYLESKMYREAIVALEKSLNYGGTKHYEVYVDLGISYQMIGETERAYKILEEGIGINDVPLLRYNHLILSIQLGKINRAKEDVEELMLYGDLSDEMLNNIMIIKDQYNL